MFNTEGFRFCPIASAAAVFLLSKFPLSVLEGPSRELPLSVWANAEANHDAKCGALRVRVVPPGRLPGDTLVDHSGGGLGPETQTVI